MLNKRISPLLLIALLFSICLVAVAQNDAKARGIAAFKAESFAQAVSFLQLVVKAEKTDDEAWCYLGRSWTKLGKFKESYSAFKKAIRLKPLNSEYRAQLAFAYLSAWDKHAKDAATDAVGIDRANPLANYVLGVALYRLHKYQESYDRANEAVRLGPEEPGPYRLRALASLALLSIIIERGNGFPERIATLENAVADLEKYLSMDHLETEGAYAKRDLSAALYFLQYYRSQNGQKLEDEAAPDNKPDRTSMKVRTKPHPSYTNYARSRRISGEICILVSFNSDGTVGPLLVLRSLETGLDLASSDAAYAIRFDPATRDGTPVTVARLVIYSFAIG